MINSISSAAGFSIDFNSPPASFQERIDSLKQERMRSLNHDSQRPSVAIFGGGPAGLSRAIEALLNGNPVVVHEKRKQDAIKRENTVRINKESYPILHYYGVYSYLLEKGLIFPQKKGEFDVRLGDLEEAMTAVIQGLSSEDVIKYGTELERIDSHSGRKADVVVKTAEGQSRLNSVGVIVVAEGARSPTNEKLLGSRRITVLPSIPVVAALFKDDRPRIAGVSTFFEYVGKTMIHTAANVYYHTLFLFKCVFQAEHIFNPNRKIGGTVGLSTPGQNYLGLVLSKTETEEGIHLSEALKRAKEDLVLARQQNRAEEQIASLEEKVTKAQEASDSYFKYWTYLSCCFDNVFNIMLFILGKNPLKIHSLLPLDKASIIPIGADKSSASSKILGETPCLIAGDALATVDPSTGLGCNTAVQMAIDFKNFLHGMDGRQEIDSLCSAYNHRCHAVVSDIHAASIHNRSLYRHGILD